MTEWRAVPGYPNYEVSDNGRVRRVGRGQGTRPWAERAPAPRNGYPSVWLHVPKRPRQFYVHAIWEGRIWKWLQQIVANKVPA